MLVGRIHCDARRAGARPRADTKSPVAAQLRQMSAPSALKVRLWPCAFRGARVPVFL